MNLIEYSQDQTDVLNENKYFIGLMMIMVNIGARFIIDELNDEHRKIFKNSYFRRAVIFAVIFMATRDIFTAFILTVVFAVILSEFLGKEEDNKNTEDKEKGASFNKTEIDNAIQKLKAVHTNL